MSSLPPFLADKPADLARAAELLRAGEIVALPTETVYGLAADADQAEAVNSEEVFADFNAKVEQLVSAPPERQELHLVHIC